MSESSSRRARGNNLLDTSQTMASSTETKSQAGLFPRRVKIRSVIRSRYEVRGDNRFTIGTKPLSWDQRIAGVDEVVTETGEQLRLFSNGGQSTPAPGWELLLTGYATEREVAVAPAAADPLVIERLSSTPHFSDAAPAAAAHSKQEKIAPDAPIVWTLYGIAKAA